MKFISSHVCVLCPNITISIYVHNVTQFSLIIRLDNIADLIRFCSDVIKTNALVNIIGHNAYFFELIRAPAPFIVQPVAVSLTV